MPFGEIPVAQLAQYGSSLTIEETTAPARSGTAQPRKVVLSGSALPFRGAEWAGENALTTTWYPGNSDEATQQNLGPRELPSAWEGEWRRTLLGRTPVRITDETGQESLVVRPDVLRDTLEDMYRGGARLRVTWAVTGASIDGPAKDGTLRDVSMRIVREGRAKSWRFPHDRHTDIRWSVEFHWLGRGRDGARVSNAKDDTDVTALAAGLEASINATTAAIDNNVRTQPGKAPKAVPQITLGQLEQLAKLPSTLVKAYSRKLQSVVSDFKRVGDIAHTLASQPASIANTVIDLAHNTASVANNFIDEMSRIPLELQSTKTRVASMLRAANGLGKTTDSAIRNARQAQAIQRQVEKSSARYAATGHELARRVRSSSTTRAGSILAVYITKAGETSYALSMKFYGTPDHARDILRANRLPEYTPIFRRGQIIFIPALAGSQQRSA